MRHDCPTYLKSIGKSKALAATLSNTEPEDNSDNEDDGILNAFTATINPTDGIVEDVVEEEELVESKFEKMDDQDDIHTAYEKLYKLSEKHEKFYRLTTKKLSDVELDREELSTKFDEANQTIGALRFENNFLAEKISKGSKRGLKLILVPRCYHAVALLSGKPLVAIWLSMTGSSTMMTEMLLLLFRLLRVSLLSPRVFNIFLFKLKGCF